ncbi:MAG: phosphotransferase family protein [Mycobacterium sp.]
MVDPTALSDLSGLRDILRTNNVDVCGELRSELISGGRSNLTYLLRDDNTRWVLRRPPTAGLTQSAHDVGREYRVVSGLQHSGVPVAPAVTLCEDTTILGFPFAVFGFVDGDVVRTRDELTQLDDNAITRCATELVRTLAALHAVDYTAHGLSDLGRPTGFPLRQAQRWARQWEDVRSADTPDAQALTGWLLDNAPELSGAAVVHGDFRVDNVMIDADTGAVRAVLDWELSTLGDPLTDIALMCACRDPLFDKVLGFPAAWTSPRWPSPAELAHRYSVETGRDLVHWRFYQALAYFKLAVIAAGIAYRHRSGATSDDQFRRAGDSVDGLFAAGLRAARS